MPFIVTALKSSKPSKPITKARDKVADKNERVQVTVKAHGMLDAAGTTGMRTSELAERLELTPAQVRIVLRWLWQTKVIVPSGGFSDAVWQLKKHAGATGPFGTHGARNTSEVRDSVVTQD